MRASSLLAVVLTTGACTAKLEGPTPTPATVGPALVCNEQLSTEVVLSGSGFAPLVESGLTDTPALVLPQVTLVRTSDVDGANTAAFTKRVPDAPTDASTSGLVWRSASAMAFSVTPTLALEPGLYDVQVQNPAGATGTASGALLVVPRPTLTALEPAALCTEAGGEIVLKGDFFLAVGSLGPTVTIAGHALPAVQDDCRTLAGSTGTHACRTLTIEVPASLLEAGPADVVITNPAPAACASTDHERAVDPLKLEVVPPPTLTGVTPSKLCTGGGRLTLTGTNFRPGATVSVGGLSSQSIVLADPTSLTATFGAGAEMGGPYDVTITTPEGCSATSADEVTVVAGPQLFFVDPPVAYNGIGIQLTAYGSGLSNGVTVELVKGESRTTLTTSYDPTRATRLKLDLPAALEPGTYSLELVDDAGCPTTLADALHVVDTLNVPVARVEPPFGWTEESTGITVLAADSILVGQFGFQSIPRLYLSREGSATPIESVTVIDEGTLTAVVPAHVTPGTYTLVVVNPDGSVGVLDAAFKVTQNPPPKTSGLAPGSLPTTGVNTFVVQGSNFRQATVALTCRGAGGGETSPNVTVGSQTATAVTASVDTSTIPAPSACVVRVTDGDEGSYVDFSALVITNPAQNLTTPVAGPSLVEARRAHRLVSLRASGAARYLYAIGGDDGVEAGAKDTVEGNAIDVFGTQGPTWTTQRHHLTTKRTHAGAVAIGRFVYAVGGSDGTAPIASVERAAILDPEFRPEIEDLDLQLKPAGESGLAAGAWYYRVAAVMGPTDAFNPDGETLASERFPLLLPALAGDRTFALTIHWSAVAGAVAYRVYRSPAANAPAGAERLLTTVAASSPRNFVDTGLVDVAADEEANKPMPIGSLGKWHAVASLGAARKGAAVTALADRAQANRWWIYAAGGLGASALTSIERLQIDVAADGAQTAGTWSSAGASLAQGRWQTGAFAATSATSSRVASGKAFLWFGPGRNADDGTVSLMEGAEMQADGSLGALQSVDVPATNAGYGSILAGNFLYTFGGGGLTDRSAKQGEICGAGVGGCQGDGPLRIRNWNQATATRDPRTLAGSVLEGATIYLVGGVGSTGTGASTTTEQLIW